MAAWLSSKAAVGWAPRAWVSSLIHIACNQAQHQVECFTLDAAGLPTSAKICWLMHTRALFLAPKTVCGLDSSLCPLSPLRPWKPYCRLGPVALWEESPSFLGQGGHTIAQVGSSLGSIALQDIEEVRFRSWSITL